MTGMFFNSHQKRDSYFLFPSMLQRNKMEKYRDIFPRS